MTSQTRRWGVILAVVVLLGAVVALATRDDGVRVEPVTVTVPTSVDDPTPIELDAALYLPADASEDDPRPAVVLGHGFGSDRTALEARAREVAVGGRVALTWSARGFGGSGGEIDLIAVDGGARDVLGLVDLLATRPEVRLDRPGDPVVAIAGASYGGGHALQAATVEPRLDAVVAVAAWYDLADALAPAGILKEQWASVLFTGAALQGLDGLLGGGGDDGDEAPDPASFDPAALGPGELRDLAGLAASCGGFTDDLCDLYVTAATAGRLDAKGAARLEASSPAGRLADVDVPVLLVQGQQDTLFDLEQARRAALELDRSGEAHALRWVPGGHGQVGAGDPGGRVRDLTDRWLDRFVPLGEVAGSDDELDLRFQWVDEVSGSARPTAGTLPPPLVPRPDVPGELVLGVDGRQLVERPGSGTAVLVRPPGALPASISTLPGLGGVGDLLPSFDLPGQSASFTGEPLPQDLSLAGPVTVRLTPGEGAAGEPLFLKLQEVGPDGGVRLLGSNVRPVVLGDGPAEVVLGSYGVRIEDGSRLRLTLATTDLAWPVPRETTVALVDVDGLTVTVAPEADVDLTPPLVRIAIPLLLALVLVAGAVLATRRAEQRLADEDAEADAPPVRIRGLRKVYADGKVAVDGLDLDVGRGQVVGLLGPNGAGKTTTMRMLLGLVHPSDGSIEVFGHAMRPGHPVLGRVGVLVEGPGFVPTATGRENLESWWRAGGRPLEEARLDRALDVAGLGAAIDRPTRSYSHGMRQRLAIAQALLGEPELLVLDEPTDGLDPEQIRAMRELVARLGEEGVTVLVSSHLLAEVEQMCTHVAVVNAGTVVAAGPVADLVGATRSVVVRTDDRDRARQVLVGLVGSEGVEPEADGLAVDVEAAGIDVADLVDALVAAGLRVAAVTPRGRLEDAFLALTGTGATAAAEGPEVRP